MMSSLLRVLFTQLSTFLFGFLAILGPLAVEAAKLRDISTFAGVRSNQLIGYGLVVGLDGSGDQTTQTPFTIQSTVSLLQSLGVTLPLGKECSCEIRLQ